MPGGEQGERNATRPPSGRLERRGRGASALIDAVFPQSEPSPTNSPHPGGDRPVDLLTRAVAEIAQRSGAEYASAWLATENDGVERVATYARSGEPPPDDLEPGAFEALRRLARATDLGDPSETTAVGRTSDASGLTAAVAVGRQGTNEFAPALAILALGGSEDALGSVRPKTLALLQEVAQQLSTPLTTLAALQQISGLDDSIRWLDRQAALGEMLGEIVHEIRNPLVSVKTFLDLLPNRLDDTEFLTDFRGVVLGEVTRLERLLDTVLQHAQPQRLGDAESQADVSAAMKTLGALLAHRAGEKQIRLVCQVEPETGPAARLLAHPKVLHALGLCCAAAGDFARLSAALRACAAAAIRETMGSGTAAVSRSSAELVCAAFRPLAHWRRRKCHHWQETPLRQPPAVA